MNSDSSPILRKLTTNDLVPAVQLSAEVGWNQTEQDWRLLLELSPGGCLAIEVAGELASTATLLCYGTRLAWVGMVLTKTEFRGRGYARRLLNALLELADRLGIESVKLDATEQGRPLYEKLGFRAEQAVERWERIATEAPKGIASKSDSLLSVDMFEIDSQAFGADRSELLKRLSTTNPPQVLGHSYLFTRKGRLRNSIAPCVAVSPESARALVGQVVQVPGTGGWYWDLLAENLTAITIATDLGFASKRCLVRMVRGKDLRGVERLIYALGGFELG
jgi:GNAT superfamily N-acetyltransferase